ncbi:MAG: peptide chain release factor N(5)-glutamine methyltransferase [Cyclobacteriaceae bacterium]|nr:peptide chain release factor N(5)-glutamine methyltransferase [Cyclobacteriaceae bacterium]
MNAKKLYTGFIQKLTLDESAEEIQQLGFRVMEHKLGLSATDVLMEKDIPVPDEILAALDNIANRLNNHEPVQYILAEEEFLGKRFIVTPAVLIPRPETEELVHLASSHIAGSGDTFKILDIGTGSGCIAVSLRLLFPQAEVYASDASEDALTIAQKNANRHEARVNLFKHDILNEDILVSELDIIVSNPPYVAQHEKEQMQQHVLAHEPHLALFVPDNDPLIFYKAIALRGKRALKSGGKIVVEINALYGAQIVSVFESEGYSGVSISKDINGQERFVCATFNGA